MALGDLPVRHAHLLQSAAVMHESLLWILGLDIDSIDGAHSAVPLWGQDLRFGRRKTCKPVEEDHIDHLGWSRILYEKIG